MTALHKLNPENNQAGVRISATHIMDEFDLSIGMLVRMMVWSSGAVAQGIPGAIVAAFPTADILPVGFIFDGSFGDAIFLGIPNQ